MLDQLNTAIGFASVMLLLSMIITVVVQAISALLDLRGQNLVWGLANLFQQICPEATNTGKGVRLIPPGINTAAEELAKAVATHPALSHTGRVYKAKAIRPDELLMVLQKLGSEVTKDPAALSDAAKKVLNSLLTSDVPGTPDNTETMQKLAAEFAKRFPTHQVMLQDALNDIAGKTTQIAAGVDKWFHTVMDRASDRFVRNCRFWTVTGAAVLAFVFGVDSIQIYKTIATDATVRSKLVANAASLQQQAEKAMGNLGSMVIKNLAQKPEMGSTALLQNLDPNLATCTQGHAWLNNQKASSQFVSTFDEKCESESKDRIQNFSPELVNLNKELTDSAVALFPSSNRGSQATDKSKAQAAADPSSQPKTIFGLAPAKLGGEFITLLLLSLGAPFWFNTLRQLSSLKPSISTKVAGERKQAEEIVAKSAAKERAKAAGA